MGSGNDAVPDRTMLDEGQQTLSAQQSLAPQSFDLYSTWAPQYSALGSNIYLNSLNSLYSGMGGQVNAANSDYRQMGIADINSMGQNLYQVLQNVNTNQGGLMQGLSAQAQGDLVNAALTPRDEYDARQSVRLQALREGKEMNNSATWKELQGVETLKNQRQNEAQTFASGVANMQDSLYSSPAYGILGANSAVPQLANAAAMQSAYGGITADMYNPFQNAYAADVYNTNYNAEWQSFMNDKEEIPKMVGAGLGMVGSIVGGIFGGPLGAKIGGIAGKKTGYGYSTIALNM